MKMRATIFVLGAAVLMLSGCGPTNTFVEPPPPEVDVQKPLVEDTTIYLEFPGRTQAFMRVEIRARVKGFLKERKFQPGQYVEEEQVLFTIEKEQFKAAVAAGQGNVAAAQADLEIAKANVSRRVQAGKGAVSEIDLEAARADQAAAVAAVKIADAALADADRDLTYTDVTTPTKGRVSRDLVDRGNLVGATDPTLLTTVIQDDPVYFNFEVNERTIIPFLRNRPDEESPEGVKVRSGEDRLEDAGPTLTLALATGTVYPIKGTFDFIDNAVNPETGTVQVRAVFDNPDGDLADSMFGRIGIPQLVKGAVMVPRAALQRDLGGSFALVVGEGNKVERRVVTPSNFTVGEYRIVDEGLGPDDLVIVSNLQRARDGIVVAPKEVEAGAPAGPAGELDEEPSPAEGETSGGGGEAAPEEAPAEAGESTN
jgi:multidrug efflux system membrane fusion protein